MAMLKLVSAGQWGALGLPLRKTGLSPLGWLERVDFSTTVVPVSFLYVFVGHQSPAFPRLLGGDAAGRCFVPLPAGTFFPRAPN